MSKNAKKPITGYVMSGDTPVARFDGSRVTPILENRTPLCFRRSGDLVDWLEHRAVDRHRTNSRVLKRILRLGDTSDLNTALRVHGATVTDNYWIRIDGENVSWNQVLFSKDYFADVALRCGVGDFAKEFSYHQLNTPTPELTNTGSFEKCWRLVNGGWTMFKASTPKERFSEIFIYRLCDKMGLPAAEYYAKGGYTATPDFTAGKTNFEPMRYLVQDDEDYGRNYEVLRSFGKSLERQYLDILFMDALTLNPDRHTENYGILRDRETGEILSMAPNFDNNLSLISRGYGMDGKPPANLLIGFFHELLEDKNIKYQYPALPNELELRAIIRDAAGGLDVDQEYVFQMIQTNYENLTSLGCKKKRRASGLAASAYKQQPSELERAARELIDKADTILNTESDEPGDQYGE